jgi:hypothetical protein
MRNLSGILRISLLLGVLSTTCSAWDQFPSGYMADGFGGYDDTFTVNDRELIFEQVMRLPNATGIEFKVVGDFLPSYPIGETHDLLVTYIWGPTASGPWSTSQVYSRPVPGGYQVSLFFPMFVGPDALFAGLRMQSDARITGAGEFVHNALNAPEPSSIALAAIALVGLVTLCRRKRA